MVGRRRRGQACYSVIRCEKKQYSLWTFVKCVSKGGAALEWGRATGTDWDAGRVISKCLHIVNLLKGSLSFSASKRCCTTSN